MNDGSGRFGSRFARFHKKPHTLSHPKLLNPKHAGANELFKKTRERKQWKAGLGFKVWGVLAFGGSAGKLALGAPQEPGRARHKKSPYLGLSGLKHLK